MIDSLNRRKLYDVFNRENQRQIQIPIFQRAYTWKNDNWEKILNDVFSEDSFFMGAIIGVKEGDTSHPLFILIDGQQRLTTISLFILSLYKRLTEISDDETNEEYIELKNDIKKRLTITKNNRIEPRLVLSLQNNNNEDFEYFVNSILLNDSCERPQNLGNRRLSYLFNFFYDYCNKEINSLKDAEDIYNKIKNLTFVEIEENSFANAFKLFEVLNNRGVPLSAMDIIRNTLFKELHEKGLDLEKNNLLFNKVMDNLLNSNFQTRFLRQFYMAFKNNKRIKMEGISKATISNIIDIYEKLVKKDPIYLLDELKEKSEIYKQFIIYEGDELDKFNDLHENLANLGIAPSYTLLLYCKSNNLFNDINYKKLLGILRNFFIRRNIMDIPPTRELDTIFMNLVEKLEKLKSTSSEEELLKTINEKLFSRKELKDNELLKQRLLDDIYETNPRMARYLICLVEENLRGKDMRVNLWEKTKSNKYLFTIEHILPQESLGKNKEWINELGTENEEEARKLRDQFCHKLGNLTLTTSNSNLSDFNFKEKKNRVDKTKKPVGYNNGFKINEFLMQQSKWDIEQIKKRTDFFINKILEITK